jgi:hypothetical protein
MTSNNLRCDIREISFFIRLINVWARLRCAALKQDMRIAHAESLTRRKILGKMEKLWLGRGGQFGFEQVALEEWLTGERSVKAVGGDDKQR